MMGGWPNGVFEKKGKWALGIVHGRDNQCPDPGLFKIRRPPATDGP